jgi:uncharacterized protein Usg
LAAILVGSRDHRIQFWKGAIQGPFHQSLVQIGRVASEELIKMGQDIRVSTYIHICYMLFNQQQCFIYSTASFLSNLRAKKVEKLRILVIKQLQQTRIQFWKGAIQGPFHQSLVQIGRVASEELIKMGQVS